MTPEGWDQPLDDSGYVKVDLPMPTPEEMVPYLNMYEGEFVVLETEVGNFVGVVHLDDRSDTVYVHDGLPGRRQMVYRDEIESVALVQHSPLVEA